VTTPSDKYWDHVVESLCERGVLAERNGDLGALTTYRVGGKAAVVAKVASVEDVANISAVMRSTSIVDVIVVGNGSNMLVADVGFDGLAVLVESVGSDEVILEDDGMVVAHAHISLPQVARQTVSAQRCGMEWAVGVPGTVGGGVRMNAGGHGSDMAASVQSARIFHLRYGKCATVSAADLGLRFRGSCLSDDHVVLSATLLTSKSSGHDDQSCNDKLSEIVRWRRENQPGGQNAGSVFVNPGPDANKTHLASAGELIDSAGLRGTRLGSAVVSDKHANFIQSDVGGLAGDVLALMQVVQERVFVEHGIKMRSEIRLVGFNPSQTASFADGEQNDPNRQVATAKLDMILRDGELLS
jgi:UDP-N-acetylmuramate dehydrogenase